MTSGNYPHAELIDLDQGRERRKTRRQPAPRPARPVRPKPEETVAKWLAIARGERPWPEDCAS